MHHQAAVLLLMTALGVAAIGQPVIYLKKRQIDTSTEPRRAFKGPAEASGGRQHLMVQFTEPLIPAHAAALVERGAVVLSYIHEDALMVSVAGDLDVSGLPVRWVGRLEPDDKISVELAAGAVAQRVIVEFHADVDLWEARTSVLAEGGELVDHPDLRGSQLLALVTAEQIWALAARDDVAYIFPASDELTSGAPLVRCALAGTAGAPAQLVAKVGEGWDGAGRGSAALTYTLTSLTSQLPAIDATATLARAWMEWGSAAKITFAPASNAGPRNINVLFGSREHGDGYAFDGAGGALAHTFYPSPITPEPLAGDMHFDEDERWRTGGHTDLYSVALHEAGHALGLGHSDRPGAVMYPYYSQLFALTDEDRAAIQALYAAPASNPSQFSLTLNPIAATTTSDRVRLSGSVAGGVAPAVVRWSSDRSGSGVSDANPAFVLEVPLATGSNSILITATDAHNASVARTLTITRAAAASPVTIRLSDPGPGMTFSTTAPSLRIQGTALHPSGIRRVTWRNASGGEGTAVGASSWDIASIPLAEGLNTITLQATAADGAEGTLIVQVTSTRAAVRDVTAPLLTITSPGTATSFSSSPSIVVKGTASDNVGVQSVHWFSGSGGGGAVNGTASWATPAIPIYVGVNTIVIRAFDAAGNVGWRSIQITRLR